MCRYVWVACIPYRPKIEMDKFKMRKNTKTVECEISISLLIAYSPECRAHREHARTFTHLQQKTDIIG